MSKRWMALMMATVLLLALGPCAAAQVGDPDRYELYNEPFENAMHAHYGPIYPGEDGFEVSRKLGRYLPDEGVICVLYMDEDGNKERYQLTAYGEGSCWRLDYYLLENALVGINRLTEGYVIHSGFDNPEHMFYSFESYVQDGEDWYQMDDVGKMAYKLDEPPLHSLQILEVAFENGLELAEPYEDGRLLNDDEGEPQSDEDLETTSEEDDDL